jgi:general secretion pathway protein L
MKRLIGIDIDRSRVRVAIAHEEKGAAKLVSLAEKNFQGPEEFLPALEEALGGERHFGDRLAAALPAGDGFVRHLKCPFADPRKIEAALDFELSTQLPVAMEECLSAFRKPVPDGEEGFQVTAAAVRAERLQTYLEPFDRGAVPLQTLDLAPFAFAAGLKEQVSDGVLATLTEEEITLALVSGGHPGDYRFLPDGGRRTREEILRFLLRESETLQKASGHSDLPLFLIGSGVTPELIKALVKEGRKVETPSVLIEDQPVEAEYMPAVALALRAGAAKEEGFNFRRGPFVLRSEWAALKKGLIAAAILLVLSGTALAGSAYLNYAHQAHRAEALRARMVRIFKETFPNTHVIVDIPLQMDGKIKEMKKRSRLIGAGAQGSPLVVLREISKDIPKDITIDVREFNFGPDAVRLNGVTTSFDAINKVAKSLERSSLFKDAQITDAKMSIDGSKVDFHLNLTYNEKDTQ